MLRSTLWNGNALCGVGVKVKLEAFGNEMLTETVTEEGDVAAGR